MALGVRMIARSVVTAIVGAYLLLCVALFFLQRSMVFPRPALKLLTERVAKVVHIEGVLPTIAWHVPAGPGNVTIVRFHGNGSQLADEEWLALECKSRELGYFAIEYPGYGVAPGEPSQDSVLAAAEAGVQWLEKSGVARTDMVLFGQSLGTAPAIYLAGKGYGRRLILATPYTSIGDIGARAFPFLPVRLLLRDNFPAGEWAASVSQLTKVIHGTEDEVIPYDIGKALADKLPNARLQTVVGAGHNTLWDKPERLVEALRFGAAP
jgi:uncharacterized protein